MTHEDSASAIARRSLFVGAGAAALAGAGLVAAPPAADAVARRPSSTDGRSLGVPTGLAPIGSAPISGYTYIHKTMWDFSPESYTSGRTWTSAGGVYAPNGGGDTLWTMVELPPGALLKDVEWYLSATAETGLLGRLWVAGTPTLMISVADGSILGSSTFGLVRAARIAVPTTTNGPFPLGTQLALGAFTPGDASVAINGVRVGFTRGGGGTGVLAAPVRAYDSRVTGGKLAAGEARTITLPAATVPPGVAAVIVNVTALGSSQSGTLSIYQGNQAAPAGAVISFGAGETVRNEVSVGITNTGQVKVLASVKSHVILDVVGLIG